MLNILRLSVVPEVYLKLAIVDYPKVQLSSRGILYLKLASVEYPKVKLSSRGILYLKLASVEYPWFTSVLEVQVL